jgi:predicted HTH transcriptional regulator
VGSTNRRADTALIAELKRYTFLRTFDEEPLFDLDSEAIDFRAASESFNSIRTLKKAELESLGIMIRHQGHLVPTVGGMILFGKERTRYFPDAWIQAGRFHSTDRGRILDSAQITEHLPKAVEESILFIQRSITRELVIDGVRRTERWAYPLTAIREAVINAIVHADYSQSGAPIRIAIFNNRLEVENPGLLPFGLTIDDIHRGVSRLRNRVVGRVFRELGFIEQWGSGIQRMVRSCEEFGLAPPLYEEIGTHFRVTLFAARHHEPELDLLDQAVVDLLAEGNGFTTRQFAERLGRSSRAMRSRLLKLVEKGLVVEVGSGPNDPKRKYYLAGNGS